MEESQVNVFEEFDPQTRQAVEGLTFLGHLTKDVEFCGHTFTLRTLRAGEEIAAGQAIEETRGTVKEPEAWMGAQVALALITIDYDDEFCPPAGPDQVAFAKARYRWLTTNWYPPTIDFLYQEYLDLKREQIEAFRAAQDLSARSLPPSSPSVDSLTEPGISGAPISLETQP